MSGAPSAGAPVVAFLRGLNVGGHRLSMDTLRGAFRAMGFGDARTFIASGNVVFDAAGQGLPTIEETIEKGLAARLGYAVDTFVRTAGEVSTLARPEVFRELERGPEDRIHVIFLKKRPPEELRARVLEVVPEGDAITSIGRDLLWLRRGKLSDVKLRGSDPVQAVSRIPSTMRNLNTLQRLSTTLLEST